MTAVAGLITWLLVLIAVLGGPLPVALAVGAVCAVAALQRGHRGLILMALASAGIMLIIGPLVHRWGVDVVAQIGPIAITREGIEAGVLYGARLAAAMLVVELLASLPVADLLVRAARLSPEFAVAAALAVRLGPLMHRDVELVAEELRMRGWNTGRPAPVGDRLRAGGRVAEAFVSGMFERSFSLAQSLTVRGFGGQFDTRPLRPPPPGLAARSALATVLAAAAAAMTVVSGPLAPPGIVAAMAVAAAGAVLVGILGSRHSRAPTAPAGAEAVGLPGTTSHSATARGEVLVDVRDLTVHRGRQPIPRLHVEHLSIRAGEWVAISGPSGAGKSTLLRVLAGLIPELADDRRSGTVAVTGVDPAELASAVRAATVGVVFQDPERHAVMPSVAEELAFPLRASTTPPPDLGRAVDGALADAGLSELDARSTLELSGGELQHVEVAAALVARPRIVLLDEALSQLDPQRAAAVEEQLVAYQQATGAAIISVEHDRDRIARRASRLVVVRGGRIAADVDLAVADRRAAVDRELGAPPVAQAPVLPAAASHQVRCVISGIDCAMGNGRTLRVPYLALPPGAVVALTGPVGAGKTTFLRVLAGILPSGDVRVDGARPGTDVAVERACAYVAQHAGPSLPGMTVREVVETTAAGTGRGGTDVDFAVEAAGLAALVDRHPMDLSVGERQRLAVIAGTLHRPPLWLLDEPGRGLDAVGQAWLRWHLRSHARAGGVAVVATHDPELLAGVAGWTLELRVLVSGDTEAHVVSTGAGPAPQASPAGHDVEEIQ